VYSIGPQNDLTPLLETPYARELDLQEALADHPALLAGDQMNPVSPRRFVLATSEAGIAISEASGNVFSLDLLFLDQDAIPTLVEVKRGTDTRLRREVIGQLLEYAANVCAFWSAEKIRSAYESTCSKRQLNPQQNVEDCLGVHGIDDYESFWQAVRLNLERQQLRLVLVADKIGVETLRIVEYLNRQMATTDVFAIAVPQYAGGSVRAVAPRVLNPSLVELDRKKAAASPRGELWTRQRFYEQLEGRGALGTVAVFAQIERWAEERDSVEVAFGRGLRDGSIQISCVRNDRESARRVAVVFLTLWTSGGIEIEFQYIAARRPFDSVLLREQLRSRLNAIGPISLPEDRIDKRPNISYELLLDQNVLRAFLDVQEWLVETFLDVAEN
jgi:hypothetical protein